MIIIALFFHFLDGIKGCINSIYLGEYVNFRPTIMMQFVNENTQSNILLNTYLPISVTHLVYSKYRKENLLNNLMDSYKKSNEKLSEKSKEINQLEWVKLMNNYKNMAEEVILKEIIYTENV